MSLNITFTIEGLTPEQAQALATHLREALAAPVAEPKAEKPEPKAEKPEPTAEKPKAEKPEPSGITRDSLKSLCLGKVRDVRGNAAKIKVILNNRLLPEIHEDEFADIQAKLEAL